jgi:hypothetical protein
MALDYIGRVETLQKRAYDKVYPETSAMVAQPLGERVQRFAETRQPQTECECWRTVSTRQSVWGRGIGGVKQEGISHP